MHVMRRNQHYLVQYKFQFCREADVCNPVQLHLAQVKDYFANPIVPDADKAELLEKLAKDAGFSENTQNFLGLLVQVHRPETVTLGPSKWDVAAADSAMPWSEAPKNCSEAACRREQGLL